MREFVLSLRLGAEVMRVLIDVLTPKQCLFLGKLSSELEAQGHQVLRTTREYREVNELLRLKGFDALTVGRHGGASLSEKLRSSAERVLKLIPILEDFRPDVVVSFSSPEAARAAFGLGTHHLCVNDSPHAEAVARLTVPISRWLFTPKIVGKRAWTRFGIRTEAVTTYDALDPVAWLRGFEPDPTVLDRLKLDRKTPIIVLRPAEEYAAYLLGKDSHVPFTEKLAEKLLRVETEYQLVVLPRYTKQVEAFRAYESPRLVVAESVVDATSLLSYSSVFIGAGGTMTTEACLLGVPSFSCYPDEPYIVEKFLLRKGLLTRMTSIDEALSSIQKVLLNPRSARHAQSMKARRLLASMEDPIEVVVHGVEAAAG